MNLYTKLQEQWQSITPSQWAVMASVMLLTIAMLSVAAIAGTGGEEFQSIYDRVGGWLSGVPGKIIAVLALGFAFFNVIKQNFIAAVGAFVACLVLAEGEEIIEGFLTAAPMLPTL